VNEKAKTEPAEYFGLKVEVICRMEHCALIRFGDREFVVDAEDLMFAQASRQVGRSSNSIAQNRTLTIVPTKRGAGLPMAAFPGLLTVE